MAGRIRFPISSQVAESNLMSLEKGKSMTKLQRETYLMPFKQTDILKLQMLNLVMKDDSLGTIVLKQSNSRINKDKFSALIYALYWCKMDEEKAQKKKSNLGDFVFYS
jgi:phage terminase large subunit-like protein|nr:MAG TPA_asm: terminase large subunit [Caudoviricetes sp.]